MRKAFLGLAIAMLAWAPAPHASADSADERAAAEQIAVNMKESGELKDYRVAVKYQKGVAWLMGSVTSAQQKQAAERIARQSPGVERVVSKLEIAGAASESREIVQPAALEAPAAAPAPAPLPQRTAPRQPNHNQQGNMPVPFAHTMQGHPQGQVQPTGYGQYQGCPPGMAGMAGGGGNGMQPMPMGHVPAGPAGQAVSYDNPQLPGYAWPSYAAYPNYAALTYPKQYSSSAWPYIGPFYPYPQVPLGWRKVTLEWDDGWWMLDFKDNKN